MLNRKLNRLKGFDYTNEGFYFVTVNVKDRIECLGSVKDGTIFLNQFGENVKNQWIWLSKQYPYIQLDEFIVMPNHFHGLLCIVGNGRDRSLHIKSLSELIGAFKTTSSKLIHNNGLLEFRWQKSFYDHIIRNDVSLNRIRQYVINNPSTWADDIENKDVRVTRDDKYYSNIIGYEK